jgi:hypothetical protein
VLGRGLEERVHDEQADSDHDRAIGKIKSRPPSQVDEIDDIPQPDSVDEISHSAPENEPKCSANYNRTVCDVAIVQQDSSAHDCCNQREK